MSKQQKEEKQKDLLNPYNYGYMGTENVVMSGAQFDEIRRVVQDVLSLNVNESYPQLYSHFDTKNQKYVKNPTEEQLKNGSVRRVMDIERTIKQEPKVNYTESGVKLIYARMILEDVHVRNVNEGNATHVDVIRSEIQKQVETPIEKEKEKEGVVVNNIELADNSVEEVNSSDSQ